MTKIIHTCQNPICTNIAEKDKYGNYKRYCCIECKQVSQLAKMQAAYASKDMVAIAEKRKATVAARYGVANVAQAESVKDKLRITTAATADIRIAKTKETNLKNHGVESTNSLQSVKAKKKAVFIEKYGVDHQLKIPEVAASVAQKNRDNAVERLALAAQTKFEVHGDENYNNRDKYKETCLERFGVANPSQNAEVHAKQFKDSVYDYVFESGRIVRIQGYEKQAIDKLLEIFHEDDLIIGKGDVPEIWYDLDNIRHRYFPDIYIPKENLIIEVKSAWTYEKDCETLTKNLAKRDGCKILGYNHLFIIFDSPGKKLLSKIEWK